MFSINPCRVVFAVMFYKNLHSTMFSINLREEKYVQNIKQFTFHYVFY